MLALSGNLILDVTFEIDMYQLIIITELLIEDKVTNVQCRNCIIVTVVLNDVPTKQCWWVQLTSHLLTYFHSYHW